LDDSHFQTPIGTKTRGFPPHPHGWFGFVDMSDFNRMGRYVNNKSYEYVEKFSRCGLNGDFRGLLGKFEGNWKGRITALI